MFYIVVVGSESSSPDLFGNESSLGLPSGYESPGDVRLTLEFSEDEQRVAKKPRLITTKDELTQSCHGMVPPNTS